MNKLDAKDNQILASLDNHPLLPINAVAKNIRLSSQATEQRIQKLVANNTIYGFYTVINFGKLGYELFRVHLKMNPIAQEKYTLFTKSIFNKYPAFWIGFISGSFDIILDFCAVNTKSFQMLFEEILLEHGALIQNYEIIPMLHLEMYSYNYFDQKPSIMKRTGVIFSKDEIVRIDKVDFQILQLLKSNFRMSYQKISLETKLTRNTVKYRIQQMQKSGLISGYHIMVNFRDFNRLSYKIFIAYDHMNRSQEKELLTYIRTVPGIIAHASLLGKWQLDIEIQPHNAKELQQFVIELRNKFPIIRDYELVQIIEDFGLDFLSTNLKIKGIN